MGILKLKAAYKDYLWGGHRLVEEFGEEYDGDILAEAWKLSCHPDGPSEIVNGAYAGRTFIDFIHEKGKEVLGKNCAGFKEFPILIKFIDAKDNLSIQVHPDNRYALENEGQYGKSEMWYVLDAKEGAFLYYGFKEEISREEFELRIKENTLTDVLNKVYVKKGDCLFIEAGTIHAIGKNVMIAEIQQNSNVTYRVFDYGRKDKNGRTRELHVSKALDVTNRAPVQRNDRNYPHLADCDYFTVDKLNLDGRMTKKVEGFASEASFISVLFLDGNGYISDESESIAFKKGDSFFIPAGSGKYVIEGQCDALITSIRPKADPVRIGVDIGGTDVKIGLIDSDQNIISSASIPTSKENGIETVIKNIARKVNTMLEEAGISIEQCIGVGVGIPGTIDSVNGKVVYSNNIPMENVPFIELMEKYIPLPIHIANDADCAALGESAAGAGKGCRSLVLLTLGTGVGSGFIMDGKIYGGFGVGGSEFGHMIIESDGPECTCGSHGCLEAYASATALRRKSLDVFGKSLEPIEIFDKAHAGDIKAQEIVNDYIEKLGVGIVNIINMLRPEKILLGGGISAQGDKLVEPILNMAKERCFGKHYGSLPEIAVAQLGNKAGMIGAANLF